LLLGIRWPEAKPAAASFGPDFEKTLAARRREADEFYQGITPPVLSQDQARVMRQALAGMLWSKHFEAAR
jgi:hypothetical protein